MVARLPYVLHTIAGTLRGLGPLDGPEGNHYHLSDLDRILIQ